MQLFIICLHIIICHCETAKWMHFLFVGEGRGNQTERLSHNLALWQTKCWLDKMLATSSKGTSLLLLPFIFLTPSSPSSPAISSSSTFFLSPSPFFSSSGASHRTQVCAPRQALYRWAICPASDTSQCGECRASHTAAPRGTASTIWFCLLSACVEAWWVLGWEVTYRHFIFSCWALVIQY